MMKTFFNSEEAQKGLSDQWMKVYSEIVFLLEVFLLCILGFMILYDQYQSIGIWFQFTDLHHETFAIASFAVAAGIIIGTINRKVEI